MTYRFSGAAPKANGYAILLCNWPGCRRPIPLAQWGCNTHWYSLPTEIRDQIWQAYGKPAAWQEANEAAQAWIKDMPARIAAMNMTGGEPC